MKIKDMLSATFKTKKRIMVFSILLVVIVLGVFYIATYNYSPNADTTALNKLLIEASDLTTAKLKITNITEYEDEGIGFLNRSDFIMVYEATVWAGIDIKQIKIKADDENRIIHVSIPKATIQNVKVDSSTIKYFDEKYALFNVNEKEDVNKAVELAEQNVMKDAVDTGILELADKQSATLIKGLLANGIPKEYEIKAKVVE